MDCLKLCANGKAHYQVVLSHSIVGRVNYAPTDVFETALLVQFTNEWHVDLKYNERADFTNRFITFITTFDFVDILDVFGNDYNVSYKYLKKELFEDE